MAKVDILAKAAIVATLLAFAGCDDAPSGSTEVEAVDPYDYWQDFEYDQETGRAMSEHTAAAIRFAPHLAAMRIDAAMWDGSCPAGDPDWRERPDDERQWFAIRDASNLGDLDATFCIIETREGAPLPVLREPAYDALLRARLWGADIAEGRIESLERAIGLDIASGRRSAVEAEFERIQTTLAYEREHGPVPPELGRGHTYDDYLTTHPHPGIDGAFPDLPVSDDTGDESAAPE